MKKRIAVTFAGLVMSLAVSLPAQTTITLPPMPVPAGVPFTAVVTPPASDCIDPLVSNVLALLQSTGDLITPTLVGCGPVSFCSFGAPISVQFTPPASGPGSNGSFVLLCPYAGGAAARLDVLAPGAGFTDIHAFPAALPHGPGGHHVDVPGGGAEWVLANTATVAHTVSVTIDVFAPGGTVPVASATQLLIVPAGGLVQATLPLAGLPLGPYTVETRWFDPGTQSNVTVRHGIETATATSLDLHYPAGKVIPLGGSLPARFAVRDVTGWWVSPTWSYLFCIGVLPGTTPLPGGAIFPLVPDVVVIASITDGIGGLITGFAGQTISEGVYCAHSFNWWATASGISIAHPNVPGLSGLGGRTAVVAYDPAGQVWAASQPEDVVLQ
jgi:hypothetical protein